MPSAPLPCLLLLLSGAPGQGPWGASGLLTPEELVRILALFGTGKPTPPRTEAEYRAYFVYALALVTEWPPDTFPDPKSPFTLGVLGGSTEGLELDSLQGRTVKGHPIAVIRSRGAESLLGCQMVYVTASASADLSVALKVLRGRPILTIGEQDNLTQLGGMVRCNPAENLLPSEVNTRAAKEARLGFRSQFLKMVNRVTY